MSLGKKQERFSVALARQILWFNDRGYQVRMGDVYRDPRVFGAHGIKKGYGNSKSVHKLKLAADLNIFKDGDWLSEGTDPIWAEAHKHWETLGGAKAVPNDPNHFSFEHWGCR